MAHRRGRGWAAWLVIAGLAGGCAGSREAGRGDVLREDPLADVLSQEAPGDVAYLSSQVMSAVTSASDALEEGQVVRAQPLLERAVVNLQELYARLPGEPFLVDVDLAQARLEAGEDVDLEPLVEKARVRREVLGVETFEHLEEAQAQEEAGERGTALESLRAARELLAEDLLLLPLDEVRARLLASRNAMRVGAVERAQTLLVGVPALLEDVREQEPLVLVRWQLRAAAASAERGNWARARELLGSVVQRTENFRGGPHNPLTGTVETLEAETRLLLSQVSGGARPSPSAIRRLAQLTLTPSVG